MTHSTAEITGAMATGTLLSPLLVTDKEGARLTSVSVRTFWDLGKRNEIPRVMVGRAVRYYVGDILAWIDRQRASAKSA